MSVITSPYYIVQFYFFYCYCFHCVHSFFLSLYIFINARTRSPSTLHVLFYNVINLYKFTTSFIFWHFFFITTIRAHSLSLSLDDNNKDGNKSPNIAETKMWRIREENSVTLSLMANLTSKKAMILVIPSVNYGIHSDWSNVMGYITSSLIGFQ